MQEPVLANLQGYPVLVKTPEGTFVNLRAGAAVAGPGFEQYQDNRTLIRVARDFGGPIIYESPVVTPKPAAPAKVVTIPSPVNEEFTVQPAAEYDAIIAALAPDPAEVADGGFEEPVEDVAPVQAASAGSVLTNGVIQQMTKRELMATLEKLGQANDGSRSQLVARLAPFMGTVLK